MNWKLRSFSERIEQKRLEALERISKVPLAILVWGESPLSTGPLGEVRVALRQALSDDGHLVHFSEELVDAGSEYSIVAQQVAQLEAFDIAFSIPGSPGSIAEIHDFARIPGIAHKIVAFVDEGWSEGYSSQSLVQLRTGITCDVQIYSPKDLPGCIIKKAQSLARRLQELYYMAGRR